MAEIEERSGIYIVRHPRLSERGGNYIVHGNIPILESGRVTHERQVNALVLAVTGLSTSVDLIIGKHDGLTGRIQEPVYRSKIDDAPWEALNEAYLQRFQDDPALQHLARMAVDMGALHMDPSL